ncbi:tetratricopeptide repeat protein [Marinicella gelatinilytica]|uniref:tetratricopeptide repeat protein n=1 Tax=Marinicella gelatinilytica TaxID=2996017 RepID=UPI002260F6ED|nr:tetratricopeptide repeat protein [Marinicella gelatinilytica]MCX7545820.1 tetratricopeptide repeat protein [Marinicella gelatinilytica]
MSELNILLNLMTIQQHLQAPEKQDYYIAKAKKHPEFINNIAIQYDWYRKVGQKFYFAADYAQAKKHLNSAYEIAQKESNNIWLGKSHNDLGLAEMKLGRYKQALSHFQNSLLQKQEIGNDYQIAKTLNNIGLINLYLEQPNQAVKYYESALAHYLDYSKKDQFNQQVFNDITHIYEDLAKAHGAAGNTKEAEFYAQNIVSSLASKANKSEHLRALINLSRWHWQNNNYLALKQLTTAAETLINNESNPEFIAQLHLLQAQMHAQDNQLEQALVLIEQGLKATDRIPGSILLADLLKLKAEILENSQPKKALQIFKQYHEMRAQFFQQKYDSDLKTIQHQIDTHKIEQQLLNQELANSQQQQRLQKLTNMTLAVGLILFFVTALFIFYLQRKKKEQDLLKQSIRYHKQQLLVLQTNQKKDTDDDPTNHKEELKIALVEALIDTLTIWEKTTQTSHIELAEQSKVWTVTIDNGTLRTRSLDKYLSLDKIPENPRWRNVVQTGHFVLSQKNLTTKDRKTLEQHLDDIMELVRTLSLKS